MLISFIVRLLAVYIDCLAYNYGGRGRFKPVLVHVQNDGVNKYLVEGCDEKLATVHLCLFTRKSYWWICCYNAKDQICSIDY